MKQEIKNLIKPWYYKYKFWFNDFPYRKFQRMNDCIFIHIPKTAGSSITTQLNKGTKVVGREHATWREYKARSPFYFNNSFKFTFVRNPWDRIVSTYFYLKDGGNKDNKDMYYKNLINSKYPTFQKFVLEFLNKETIWSHILFWPQWFYIIDNQDKLQVDFLGKYETLKEDNKYIMGILGININLPNSNKSKRKNYEEYYSEKTKQRIGDLYSKDVFLFKYSYNQLD